MATIAPAAPALHDAAPARWSAATRILFRFCLLYFGLYSLLTQIISSLVPLFIEQIPDLSAFWPVRPLVFWTAAHVFQVKTELVYTGSGSGDKTFDWVMAFCILVFSLVAASVWSLVARKSPSHPQLYKWFRLLIRICLAGQMFAYGFAKAIPMQMPFPYLNRLVTPYGNFSPMGVLWSSIGSSPAYEIFAGCAELLGGILLMIPRTALLGAMVCLADMTEVFALNMTYDVPVKLFSFHLILMAVILLAPELPRLAAVFALNRPVGASAQPPLFASPRANRIAVVLQLLLLVWLVGANLYAGRNEWYTYGDGRPRSPLYGIWTVEQMTVDGQVRPPLLTDNDRWRRVVFDFVERAQFQRMDDTMASFSAAINPAAQTLSLSKPSDKNWKANFKFERPAQDQLTLDGRMDSHQVHLQLHLVDRSKFMLVSRGFHWIQEYPFNR